MKRHRPRLAPVDVRIYRFLSSAVLDIADFRPVKQLFVARSLGVSRTSVAMGLRRLNAAGLLERAPSHYRTAIALYRLREGQ